MQLTESFYGYVVNKQVRSSTGRKEYKKNPVTVFAFYVSGIGINFLYADEGVIAESTSQDTLYICPLSEDPSTKELYRLPHTEEFIIVNKKKVIPIKEDTNGEDEDTSTTDERQKPKQVIRKGGRKKR